MKHYNYDSSRNQTIKNQFVQGEVCACISDMAEYLFSYEGDKYADWDEWENLYVTRCPECGEINSILHNETPDDNDNIPADCDPDKYAAEYPYQCVCGARFEEEPETEPQEIYEYWIVTPWLGEKLRDKGDPVLERWGGWIWGRTCTGQAILLDSVISEICYEMGILEGQPHEWKI
jgi:hypothetical protein